MALIQCPDCGREVSSRAISCPHCGCPIAAEAAVVSAPTSAGVAKAAQNKAEREVILAHLQDLRALELLKKKHSRVLEMVMEHCGISHYDRLIDIMSAMIRKDGRLDQALWKRVQDEDPQRLKVMVSLRKAYEPNLIPAQFRNLYGVYYLYDYLSTSQETLTNALLHLDLEQIKNKLDKVIAQQSQQILLAAVQNAQLANVQQQFDQLIDTAKSISTDTAEIAKYSAISAAHLETIKILQMLG